MVTFIGQAPSRQTKRHLGWAQGRTTKALARLAGCTYESLALRANFVNLLGRWPGRMAKGDRWPLNRARMAAKRLKLAGRVILLGQQVARAFGASRAFLEPFQLNGAQAFILPHPSRINRWWNDARNRRRARSMLRHWLDHAEGSEGCRCEPK